MAYGANLFIKVALVTEEHVDSQPRPSVCNAEEYVMHSKSRAHQRLQ